MKTLCRSSFPLVVLVGTLWSTAFGQVNGPYPDLEFVLLPVYVDLDSPRTGIDGSKWVTNLTVTNGSNVPLYVFHYILRSGGTHDPENPTPIIRPNSSFSPHAFSFSRDTRGGFLFVDRAHANDVQIALRAREITRAPDSWGTSIPVVREKQWTDGTVHLNDIAVTADVRQTIRIYGFDPRDPARLIIRVYGLNDNPEPASPDELLGEVALNLDPGTVDLFPAFLEIDNLTALVPTKTYSRVRLDVQPEAAGKFIWAFATVTNNATQQLTVIAPSR